MEKGFHLVKFGAEIYHPECASARFFPEEVLPRYQTWLRRLTFRGPYIMPDYRTPALQNLREPVLFDLPVDYDILRVLFQPSYDPIECYRVIRAQEGVQLIYKEMSEMVDERGPWMDNTAVFQVDEFYWQMILDYLQQGNFEALSDEPFKAKDLMLDGYDLLLETNFHGKWKVLFMDNPVGKGSAPFHRIYQLLHNLKRNALEGTPILPLPEHPGIY